MLSDLGAPSLFDVDEAGNVYNSFKYLVVVGFFFFFVNVGAAPAARGVFSIANFPTETKINPIWTPKSAVRVFDAAEYHRTRPVS
jgi:hypothetical protein